MPKPILTKLGKRKEGEKKKVIVCMKHRQGQRHKGGQGQEQGQR